MTPQEAFDAIKEKFSKTGKKVVFRHCSFCYYPLGYVWKDSQLMYDCGCYCTDMGGGLEPREEGDLLNLLEMNKGTDIAQRMLDGTIND